MTSLRPRRRKITRALTTSAPVRSTTEPTTETLSAANCSIGAFAAAVTSASPTLEPGRMVKPNAKRTARIELKLTLSYCTRRPAQSPSDCPGTWCPGNRSSPVVDSLTATIPEPAEVSHAAQSHPQVVWNRANRARSHTRSHEDFRARPVPLPLLRPGRESLIRKLAGHDRGFRLPTATRRKKASRQSGDGMPALQHDQRIEEIQDL